MKLTSLIFIGIILLMISCEQNSNDPLISIIQRDPFLAEITQQKKHEVQIIWTQIDRDSANHPTFTSYQYNLDSDSYFYPASTVKLPIACLALEKINELQIAGLDRNSVFHTDSAFSGQSSVLQDSTSESGQPSIAHYIKKILVVSDNDGYNRLYEFLGQKAIHTKLNSKGYDQTRIVHRLSIPLSTEENQYTNPVKFYYNHNIVHQQPLIKNDLDLTYQLPIQKGVGYIKGDSMVNEPFDFASKNFIPLQKMQQMLTAIIFPKTFPDSGRFNFTAADRRFLLKYMSQLPRETKYPTYPQEEYYDAYVKFLMYGNDKGRIPGNIRIFNKIGQAYGYMTDNSYIVDLERKVEFMLSATIHVNENQIYNDGIYEYDCIGFPFMQKLGQAIYQYELNRPRRFEPNLSDFEITYDQP